MAPHGFYGRVKPRGARVRRYICRRKGRTVSLLPDCFAAHVKGTLEEQEALVRARESGATLERAAAEARPAGQVGVAGALRWARRRVAWVRATLVTVKGLHPERFAGVQPTLEGFGQRLGSQAVLRALREVAEGHLQKLPAPVGFSYAGISPGAR